MFDHKPFKLTSTSSLCPKCHISYLNFWTRIEDDLAIAGTLCTLCLSNQLSFQKTSKEKLDNLEKEIKGRLPN